MSQIKGHLCTYMHLAHVQEIQSGHVDSSIHIRFRSYSRFHSFTIRLPCVYHAFIYWRLPRLHLFTTCMCLQPF